MEKVVRIENIMVRRGIFETASSSVHTVVLLPEDSDSCGTGELNFRTYRGKIRLRGDKFGWGPKLLNTPLSKANWLATYFIEKACAHLINETDEFEGFEYDDTRSVVISPEVLGDDAEIGRYEDFIKAMEELTNKEVVISFIAARFGPTDAWIDHQSEDEPRVVLDQGVEFIKDFVANPRWAVWVSNDNGDDMFYGEGEILQSES